MEGGYDDLFVVDVGGQTLDDERSVEKPRGDQREVKGRLLEDIQLVWHC